MKKQTLKRLSTTLLSLVAAAALTACGGGGSDTPTTAAPTNPSSPTADVVSTASARIAFDIGATLIAGASIDEEVYNIAADIGDSWQLVLNNRAGTYVMRVLSTQYGLTTTVAAPFTATTLGPFSTISSTMGTALSVQIDNRTKTLVGNASVGNRRATVSGSGYTVADTRFLAGNYFFLGATRNVSNGQFRDDTAGSFIVAANGTDITVCDGGIVVNNACAPIPNSGLQVVPSKRLKVSQNGANGLLMLKDGINDFGILHVSAGDRGPVLIIDRFGLNDEVFPVLRAGVFYAAKAGALRGDELTGNWTCVANGREPSPVVITGATYTATNLQTRVTNTGTLQYNRAVSGNGTLIDLNNTVVLQNRGETLEQASLGLPLSSSLAVIANGAGGLEVCRRTN